MAKKRATTRSQSPQSEPSPSPQKKRATRSSSQKKVVPLQSVPRPSNFKGIEELIFVSAESLSDNPANWKTHTKRQLQSLDSEFSTVGWVLPMAYNKTTGRLIDGHGRKTTDFVKNNPIVPVVVGNWSESEERQILLHLDPIGAMFETDSSRYASLMSKYKEDMKEFDEQIEQKHVEQLSRLNEDLDSHADSLKYGAPKSFLPDFQVYKEEYDRTAQADPSSLPEEFTPEQVPEHLPGSYDLKTWIETPFNAFAPNGPFDIPNLRPDRLGSAPATEIQTWVGPETPEAETYFYIYGCAAIEKVRSSNMIVAFYTYDEKFESVWNDPRKLTSRMINMQIQSVISPNYSIWHQCPFAFEIWQTYRSRWLARYWQEAGLKVIPDILLSNFTRKESFDLRMSGIPIGLPCISVQAQQKGESRPDAYYASLRKNLLRVLDYLKPESLLLYHGPDFPLNYLNDFPETTKVHLIKSWMSERTKVMNKKEYL